MTKPVATAIINGKPYGFQDREERVAINQVRGSASFYAPGWRSMSFSTTEAAKAKMERHPGFVQWA